MDRHRIADLRILLIKGEVGGPMEKGNLLAEIYSCAGELLALADAALKIHDAYSCIVTTGSHRLGQKVPGVWNPLRDAVVSAMRDLDDLERAAREAR